MAAARAKEAAAPAGRGHNRPPTDVDQVKSLAARYCELRDRLDELRAEAAAVQAEFDRVRNEELPDAMAESDIASLRIVGVGTVSLYPEVHVNVLKSNREALHEWLREQGHGDLVTHTVNASTLRAFVKELLRQEDQVLPEDLVKVRAFPQARVTNRPRS